MTLDLIGGVVLTPEQRAIVEHPLVPLRVVAGAGTGKTTTVVARMVSAVLGGAAPESILALTFTNKAAEELRHRLALALPDLTAEGREVEVTTYHGFAWRLLQEFGALVGVERGAGVIGPGFSRQLLHESLDADSASYMYLDMAVPPQRVNDAAVLARRLGDHLKTPADVLALAPDDPDDVWGRRRELGEIVARYTAAKHRLGVVDYGDLVLAAHDLLGNHAEVRRRVRERYVLLTLDEYQDTDPGQRSMLQTVFGGGFAITAVGDTDQTIYEWRGASIANFASFPTDFPLEDGSPAPTLELTLNRRSARTILDVANAIRATMRPESALSPLRPLAEAPSGRVEVRHFRTAGEEAAWVASEVRARHDADGVEWRDIAVLFRKNRSIAPVRDAFETEGIPFEVVSLGGLLDVPYVADIHAWLRILGRPEDSAALARILLAGRYRLGLGDLRPLVAWVRAGARGVESTEEGPGWPLVEAIDRLDEVVGLTETARDRLAEFRSTHRSLLMSAQALSLAELCRQILDDTDMWAEIEARDDAARLSARLNVYRFLDLAEEWSPLRGRPSLEAFLGYLDLLQEERATDELDTATVSSGDAVALLTVHRAKGLEWDTVFIAAAAKGTFPATSLGFDNPNIAPASLPYELRLDATSLPALTGEATKDKDAMRAGHDRQEWRTAYVAVTRAKRRLIVTAASWYTPKTPKQPSALFDVVRAVPGVVTGAAPEPPGEPPTILGEARPAAPDPLFPDGVAAAIHRTLEDPTWPRSLEGIATEAYDAAMDQIELLLQGLPLPPQPGDAVTTTDVSVTGLVTLATCPRRFQYSEVDPLPRRRSTAQRRGIELHRRIELHNRGQVPFEELGDETYDLGEEELTGTVTNGFTTFMQSRYGTERPRWTETPIDIRLESGRVRGRIDAIYEHGDGSWEIVDFKSGRRSSNDARRVQLQAYAIAATDGALGVPAPESLSVSFVYFGGGIDVETELVDDGWLAAARENVDALVSGVHRESYEPVPGPYCRSCDFVTVCEEGKAHLAAQTPSQDRTV